MGSKEKVNAKKLIIAGNLSICVIVVIFVLIGMIVILGNKPPKNFQEATGKIAKYKQFDKEWYDNIVDPNSGSYFNVTFEDGMFFEAKGISYDNINREFFEQIRIGEQITLTYESSHSKPNRIYAIEYNGISYLLLDDVLAGYKDSAKSMNIIGAVVIALPIVAGGAYLILVNYKYRKRNLQNK